MFKLPQSQRPSCISDCHKNHKLYEEPSSDYSHTVIGSNRSKDSEIFYFFFISPWLTLFNKVEMWCLSWITEQHKTQTRSN
jgi:hypothetical protein